MFADDTLLYDCDCNSGSVSLGTNNDQSCCRLAEDLKSLGTWAVDWSTTFNASKSAHMLIQRRPHDNLPSLMLSSALVPLVSTTKHLGVCLTDRLSWSAHIAHLVQRVNFQVYTLKRLSFRVGSAQVVKRLYLGLVRPVLEYASPVWDGCSKADAMTLERVQLSVARAILRCSRLSTSNSNVLREIDWPTLAWRRRRFKLLLLWQLLHSGGPPSLRDHIPPMAAVRSSYSLRNQCSIAFPLCSTSRYLRSFLPSSISLWNLLPPSVSSCSSSYSFLRAVDAHFSYDRFSFGLN